MSQRRGSSLGRIWRRSARPHVPVGGTAMQRAGGREKPPPPPCLPPRGPHSSCRSLNGGGGGRESSEMPESHQQPTRHLTRHCTPGAPTAAPWGGISTEPLAGRRFQRRRTLCAGVYLDRHFPGLCPDGSACPPTAGASDLPSSVPASRQERFTCFRFLSVTSCAVRGEAGTFSR